MTDPSTAPLPPPPPSPSKLLTLSCWFSDTFHSCLNITVLSSGSLLLSAAPALPVIFPPLPSWLSSPPLPLSPYWIPSGHLFARAFFQTIPPLPYSLNSRPSLYFVLSKWPGYWTLLRLYRSVFWRYPPYSRHQETQVWCSLVQARP